MEFAAKQNVAVLPGALTPTEVVTAWSAGADFVKVFPCGPVGGDRYIKALHAALPQIPLVARGRSESTDCGQLHFVGRDYDRGWHGIDSKRGDSKKTIAAHP